jgi:hypothetical protein
MTVETYFLKHGDIVKVEGVLGYVFKDAEKGDRFVDGALSTYSGSKLPMLMDFELTTHEEKVELIIRKFDWGQVLKTHILGDLLILEFTHKDGETMFHLYDNYRDSCHYYTSLYRAAIGGIAKSFEGSNGKADLYFARSIGMRDH